MVSIVAMTNSSVFVKRSSIYYVNITTDVGDTLTYLLNSCIKTLYYSDVSTRSTAHGTCGIVE